MTTTLTPPASRPRVKPKDELETVTVKVLGIVKRAISNGKEKFIISADDKQTYQTFSAHARERSESREGRESPRRNHVQDHAVRPRHRRPGRCHGRGAAAMKRSLLRRGAARRRLRRYDRNNLPPTAPTPPHGAGQNHDRVSRGQGNASSVRVRYSAPADGLDASGDEPPVQSTASRPTAESMFLSLEALPLAYPADASTSRSCRCRSSPAARCSGKRRVTSSFLESAPASAGRGGDDGRSRGLDAKLTIGGELDRAAKQ